MNHLRAFICGEGRNELGSRSGHPVYQDNSYPGVLEALLRRIQSDGWVVDRAIDWTRIRKFKARGATPGEERNVLGLVHEAQRAGCPLVAFARDSDGDENRCREIEQGIVKAALLFSNISIIGGAAHPVLEAWILAILGEPDAERLGKHAAQGRLWTKMNIREKDTEAMVAAINAAALECLHPDAITLTGWLALARAVLPRIVREHFERESLTRPHRPDKNGKI